MNLPTMNGGFYLYFYNIMIFNLFKIYYSIMTFWNKETVKSDERGTEYNFHATQRNMRS